MTREEKQLLFKDICARLPYFPMVHWRNADVILTPVMLGLYFNEECKPYLRSMSSMTKKENKEFIKLCYSYYEPKVDGVVDLPYGTGYDWLLEHHFDFRGLIEKGLALEAPEGMYKIE